MYGIHVINFVFYLLAVDAVGPIQMGSGVDLDTHVFETPHKEVKTAADIPAWEKSEV